LLIEPLLGCAGARRGAARPEQPAHPGPLRERSGGAACRPLRPHPRPQAAQAGQQQACALIPHNQTKPKTKPNQTKPNKKTEFGGTF